MPNLNDIRCFLLDMDGTFYLGDQLLPGSLEFIHHLNQTGRDYLFLTNNSSRSADYYVQKLKHMGLSVDSSKVLTSGQATAAHVLKQFPGQKAFLLGNEFLRQEMESYGVLLDDQAPDYLIVGYDTTIDYDKMCAVCDFVRAGLPYVATHPDYNCPTETGFVPDIGAIMAFIEASTGRRADTIVGKPYGGIVEAALERTGHPKHQTAMVGDRLYTDIETGIRHGMLSVLVMSGETTQEMLDNSTTIPSLTYSGLGAMIADLK